MTSKLIQKSLFVGILLAMFVVGACCGTGKVVNYSEAPDQYDEPEGILPDGKWTLVECDRAARKRGKKGSQYIDIWKLRREGALNLGGTR